MKSKRSIQKNEIERYNILFEVWKYLSDKDIEWLTNLFNNVLKLGDARRMKKKQFNYLSLGIKETFKDVQISVELNEQVIQ